ncbi:MULTISPECIES: type II secretion system major pseudopilin GspG [unclassified Wenzhouxiangella]|uniref:type II secretion system major pseudopilin GspG n=1 Tax=unclassified Wenzhouxiangella TaxID=2613841 RepID=UPI000E3276F9|nr:MULTISPECIES: type II secretion system major pseudopilin GspG [unclassified Wenzhouxiangella]RFF26540.1 type II secretion system protein GspG [Wenzhouxiangella sp. 15181]RFP67529.1 type II secretion system protein GspG [Wenzhouxiangella sp. 15190]
MYKSPNSGFSLIELLVVLIILGLIAGLVVPNIMQRGEDAKLRAADAEVQRLSMAVDEFYLDNGRPPEELRELIEKPGDATNWNGPYVNDSNLKDPWDNAYQYRYPGEHRSFDIWSHGADGSPGGEGANADIKSWD